MFLRRRESAGLTPRSCQDASMRAEHRAFSGQSERNRNSAGDCKALHVRAIARCGQASRNPPTQICLLMRYLEPSNPVQGLWRARVLAPYLPLSMCIRQEPVGWRVPTCPGEGHEGAHGEERVPTWDQGNSGRWQVGLHKAAQDIEFRRSGLRCPIRRVPGGSAFVESLGVDG